LKAWKRLWPGVPLQNRNAFRGKSPYPKGRPTKRTFKGEKSAELPQSVGEWKAGIDAMGLPESRKKTLNELLEYAILQRFKTFTLEEIRKMIELTPLEETVAGKQLIQQGMDIGLEQGMETGLEKGQVIGQIQLIQRLLKRSPTPTQSLSHLDITELEATLAALEADWSKETKES
jgi:hypothetical protein